MSPESPDQEADYSLTPRTEAKYNKIDEDFQMMMQRNQQQRVAISGANYSLPVAVPITTNYGDSGMLQTSPQMAHTNISPRPSSSETDSGTKCNIFASYQYYVCGSVCGDVCLAVWHLDAFLLLIFVFECFELFSIPNKFDA